MSENNNLIKVDEPKPLGQPYVYITGPDPVSVAGLTESEAHLRDYWRVLLKRKWILLSLLVSVVTIVTLGSFKATPIYKATSRIEIEAEKTNVLPYKDVVELESSSVNQDQYLQTQFKILQSRSLAKRVIEVLNLRNHKDHDFSNPSFFDLLRLKLSSLVGKRASEGESEQDSKLITRFLKDLEVTPIRNSRLVEVSYYADDPRLAADIVNALANEYIQQNFESKFEATQKATEFLSKQLVGLKAKVEKSEEELMRYAQAHDILGLDEKQNVTVRTLADLNDALTKAQADRLRKESIYRTVKGDGRTIFPEVLKTPLILEIEKKLSELKQQQAKLNANFRPGWPELDQVNNQILETELQLKNERERALKSIEVDYAAAIKHESLLSQALERQKLEASRLNQNAIHYNILKREVDSNKQLYEGLLQRMKEASVSAGLKSSNIRVVDSAEVPRIPDRPKKALNIVLGAVIGLALGVGLAFFLEYMDNSIKTPEDVDRFIRLPNLGVVPSLASIYDRKLLYGGEAYHKRQKAPDKVPEIGMIAFTDSGSIIAEAYRSLRTSILLSNSGKPPKTILVTSSHQSEGKTVSSVNVAISLAQLGGRVLLLDCDMRNPNCHKVLKIKNGEGMSSYLSGNIDISSLIMETQVPNLFVVTAGKIPPNPAELLASPRMRQALALVDEFFNYVIVDSPPMLVVTDALIISTLVDGVVLVAKAEVTPREILQSARKRLQSVNAKVLGVLINQANVRGADYNYYYKYYAYGYGAEKEL